MEFSSAIRVADLNDYIAPSQDCVVALNGKLRTAQASEEVVLQPRIAPRGPAAAPGSAAAPAPGDPVKVSLHDCLACSGCITSAETVLLQQQSGEEFLTRLADPSLRVVVTISPQSRAALAAYFGLSPAVAMCRLAGWLKWLGVAAVWDLTTARDLVLCEEAAAFLERYRSSTQSGSSTAPPAVTPGGGPQHPPSGPLPVMGSSCPGWVCYAEKTHGSRVLHHLSPTRSPQGAMGGLVKGPLAAAWEATPGSLYHVSIMPCYDKKLEASRDELTISLSQVAPDSNDSDGGGDGDGTASSMMMMVDGTGPAEVSDAMMVEGSEGQGHGQGRQRVPEVDCCLTTGEVLTLLQQRPPPGCSVEEGLLAHPVAPSCAPDVLLPGTLTAAGSTEEAARLHGMGYGSSSGGYADWVARVAARELGGVELPRGALPWRALRNADLQELTLELPVASGTLPLRFARVYGFRNIQTMLRQVKMGRCPYHYVEVMACPSGCLNGGGQPKPGPGITPQQLLERLEEVYAHADVAQRDPTDNPAVAALYAACLGGRPGAPAARRVLHTTFREREKTVSAAMVANW